MLENSCSNCDNCCVCGKDNSEIRNQLDSRNSPDSKKLNKRELKTYGDLLMLLADANFADIACKEGSNRYTNKILKAQVKKINDYKSLRSLRLDFINISREIENKISSCPHLNPESKNLISLDESGYHSFEECHICDSIRFSKYDEKNFIKTYYERSYDILKEYKNALDPSEFKILDDFYDRRVPDMSNRDVWDAYDSKMKAIFKKYPIWNDWKV